MKIIYSVDVDHEKKTVTLDFFKKRFTAHSPEELEILAGVINQLSQELKKLLRSDLEYECSDADFEATDLTCKAFLDVLSGDKQEHEK